MAAVKSQAGLGFIQSVTGRKKGVRVTLCDQENPGIQKHQQNFILQSSPGLGEVWPTTLEHSKPLLFLQSFNVDLPYRSPGSIEMDEIMAAMVLTSLSCRPVIRPLPYGPVDKECGGGELSDSGSSGYWSWEQGSASPVPLSSVNMTDSSMGHLADEGLHMALELGARDKLETRQCKISSKRAYRCLWPGCGKVLTSLVGMKRHIRNLHLGGPEQSQREEDFYYTEVSSEEEETISPPSPSLKFTSEPWSSCSSTLSEPSSREAPPSSSPLSQSAPSSVWQTQTEQHYQACAPIKVIISPVPASSCDWTSAGHQLRPQISMSCRRSISMGEQWPQPDNIPIRAIGMSPSPSRGHCFMRKGRSEVKKCRKVYGVEHRDQWCTACRWKKACQRFPD